MTTLGRAPLVGLAWATQLIVAVGWAGQPRHWAGSGATLFLYFVFFSKFIFLIKFLGIHLNFQNSRNFIGK
jgi:hypothetical protein